MQGCGNSRSHYLSMDVSGQNPLVRTCPKIEKTQKMWDWYWQFLGSSSTVMTYFMTQNLPENKRKKSHSQYQLIITQGLFGHGFGVKSMFNTFVKMVHCTFLTVFDLITTHTPISAQSSDFVVLRL